MKEDLQNLAILGASLAVKFLSLEIIRRNSANCYEEVGEISKLFFYPVKSCRGIEVSSARCTPCGLAYEGLEDRCLLVCSADGRRFYTQRQQPRLALIKTDIPKLSTVTLAAPGMPDITICLNKQQRNKVVIRLFGRHIQAEDCGDEIGAWLDKFLELQDTRMVFHPDYLSKWPCQPKDSNLQNACYKVTDVMSFQDLSPLMMTSEQSVRDVSEKIDKNVTVLNFRPNILVKTGCAAFEEDKWAKLLIGPVKLHSMWLDERCKITTVNTETGSFRDDDEPLNTLNQYRKVRGHSAPVLGINVGVDVPGTIFVGDKVSVVRGEVA